MTQCGFDRVEECQRDRARRMQLCGCQAVLAATFTLCRDRARLRRSCTTTARLATWASDVRAGPPRLISVEETPPSQPEPGCASLGRSATSGCHFGGRAWDAPPPQTSPSYSNLARDVEGRLRAGNLDRLRVERGIPDARGGRAFDR